jgi:hypothetical protein
MSIVLADERIFKDLFVDTIDCKKLLAQSGGEFKNLVVTGSLESDGTANLAHLTVGTLVYPEAGVANSLLQGNLAGTGIFQGSRLLARKLLNDLNALDDHIRFDEILLLAGTKISLDTTSPYSTVLGAPSIGRITLQPGKYYIRAAIKDFSNSGGNDGLLAYVLYNADAGAALTEIPGLVGTDGGQRYLLNDETVFTTAIAVKIEFRVVRNDPVAAREASNSFVEITELPS